MYTSFMSKNRSNQIFPLQPGLTKVVVAPVAPAAPPPLRATMVPMTTPATTPPGPCFLILSRFGRCTPPSSSAPSC